MKRLLLLIIATSIMFSCTTHDYKHKKDLLTLTEDLNKCIQKNKESCCPIYNNLVFEAAINDITLDHTICSLN